MNIININTQDKMIAKDILIRTAIKLELQYIEMEYEVIIEGIYLFRFIEKAQRNSDSLMFDMLYEKINKKPTIKEFIPELIIDEKAISVNSSSNFSKLKKDDYKLQSKQVKNKVKTKVNYNRRKY